jgi:hypothetical protein
MTVTTPVAVKQARLDAIYTTWGVGAKLRIYNGSPPTDVNTALSGNTVIAEVTVVPTAAVAGPPTTKDMLGAGKPLVATAAAAGNPVTFYRVYDSAGSVAKEQGTVGTSGADLIIDNTNIASGQTVNFNTFVKTEP